MSKLILTDGRELPFNEFTDFTRLVDADSERDWTTRELFGPGEDTVEGVFVNGELVGFIDCAPVNDISRYAPWEQYAEAAE